MVNAYVEYKIEFLIRIVVVQVGELSVIRHIMAVDNFFHYSHTFLTA